MVKVFTAFFIAFFTTALMFSTARAEVEFSARLSVQPKDSKPVTGMLFVKAGKVREVTSGPAGSQVIIFRPDKKVTWMITNGGEVCMAMPYVPSDNYFREWTPKKSADAKFLGTETVHSMPCKKYQIEDYARTTVYWISERLPIPVRVENQDETSEFTNVEQGKLEDSLFELPATCKKTITRIEPTEE